MASFAEKRAPASSKLPPAEQTVYERDLTEVSDLVLLDDISCDSITELISKRLERGDMYTAIGPVLIAMNPYTLLEKDGKSIYRDGVARYYYDHEALEVVPHVYQIAAVALKGMRSERLNQCILVSGESGAGKTETAKQLMQFIAVTSGGGEVLEATKKQLLDSNPVLEGFGNAQTMRNDNSSRFGKYMELSFDFKGDVEGGQVSNYLLEKSRITGHQMGERGFHIFHRLTTGADADLRATLLGLGPSSDFAYLMRETRAIEGVDDAAELAMWRAATKSVLSRIDYDSRDEAELFRLVAFVLQLGQIEFVDQGPDASATPKDAAALATAANLIQADPFDLETALTSRKLSQMRGRTSITVATLDAAQSQQTAVTLAKETYKRLFDWLVHQINKAITLATPVSSIGILDIFGFEIFETNGFEQFCINFVNEKLQQYFIMLTLKAEQEEYAAEGVPWQNIAYFDNKVVCDLIEAKKPVMGVFPLLDEAATFKEGDTKKLMEKLNVNLLNGDDGKRHYVFNPRAPTHFTIEHYAGGVTYTADDFLDKNADTMYNDLVDLMADKSGDSLLPKALFKDARTAEEKKKRPPSVSVQFMRQVNDLMTTLRACTPNYIRCVKPNDAKKPRACDADRVAHQVQYLGLVENIRVRRAGFAYRCAYERFATRFKVICETTWPTFADARQASQDIVAGLKPIRRCWGDEKHLRHPPPPPLTKEGSDYVLGTTKVFIKEPRAIFALEMRRKACHERLAAHFLQGPVRRKLAVEALKRAKAAVTWITKIYRGKVARDYKKKCVAAAVKLQAEVRSFADKKAVAGIKQQYKGKPPRYWATKIQCVARVHVALRMMDPHLREKILDMRKKGKELALQRKLNGAARPIERIIRSFVACKRLARLERADFDRVYTALIGTQYKVIRHAKGSILSSPKPTEDILVVRGNAVSTLKKAGKEHALATATFVPSDKRQPPPGKILPRSTKPGANMDKFLVVTTSEGNKVKELALEFPDRAERDAVLRTLNILKNGVSNHTWKMKHARPTKPFV